METDQARGRPEERLPAGQLKRRGLLAAVAAVAAGVLTKVTTKPAEAADGQSMIIGTLRHSS